MLEIPLLYKDRRLEGETPLRQCQLVQFHLLYVFDAICKEYNLTYFLGGGTLLGAMRHGGFIPWDDDLDVGMPMKDYKKFLKIAKDVLPADVLLQTPKTNPYTPTPFSKLRDAYSFYFELSPYISTSDFAGIFLDIFPYEEMPEIGLKGQQFLVKACASTWMRGIWFKNRLCTSLFSVPVNWVCAAICKLLHLSFRVLIVALRIVLPVRSVFLQFENGYTHRYQKEWLYPTKLAKFEDGEFPIPNNADESLKCQYGDWHWIPPPEKRPRHATIILPTQAPNTDGAMQYPSSKA